MIRSTTQRVYDVLSGATATIYAYSTLENRIDGDYIIRTIYFRLDENNNRIQLLAFEEPFTVEQVDGLFESLRSTLGSLPFTQMLRTGIELSLLNHLSSTTKFGIAPGTNGWEIIND